MAKDPAFLFYYQDFMWGTRGFTHAERGLYIELMCEQADSKTGSIDSSVFENVIKLADFNAEKVEKKFAQDKHGFYNKILREHLSKRRTYCESRAKNRKTKKDMKNICKTYEQHMENENVNENVNENKGLKVLKNKPDQTRFLESFSGFYEQATKQPFKCDKKHYIIISNLIKNYGYESAVEKARILAIHCERGDIWFAKDGWSCFTPETLVTHWNRIVPIMTEEQKKDLKYRETYKQAEEERKLTDELLKATVNL